MSKGIKTSEFWLTLITAIVGLSGQAAGLLPEPWGLVLTTVVTAIYTVARTFLKTKEAPQ